MKTNPAEELGYEKTFDAYLHVEYEQLGLGAGDGATTGHGGKFRSPGHLNGD
jgi:hypothetical protein